MKRCKHETIMTSKEGITCCDCLEKLSYISKRALKEIEDNKVIKVPVSLDYTELAGETILRDDVVKHAPDSERIIRSYLLDCITDGLLKIIEGNIEETKIEPYRTNYRIRLKILNERY